MLFIVTFKQLKDRWLPIKFNQTFWIDRLTKLRPCIPNFKLNIRVSFWVGTSFSQFSKFEFNIIFFVIFGKFGIELNRECLTLSLWRPWGAWGPWGPTTRNFRHVRGSWPRRPRRRSLWWRWCRSGWRRRRRRWQDRARTYECSSRR